MTPFSAGIAFAAALLLGAAAGLTLKSRRAGIHWAAAIAAAVGLLLLQTSQLADLMRLVRPSVALDWLPIICVVAATVPIRNSAARWAGSLVLAACGIAAMLWGSVYADVGSLSNAAKLSLAGWAAMLALSVAGGSVGGGAGGDAELGSTSPQSDSVVGSSVKGRAAFAGEVLAWAICLAGTALSLAATGSLVYGAASGVVGFAALGVLLGARRLPGLAAVPLVCLIGLGAAFSGLTVTSAALLMSAWVGLVWAPALRAPVATGGLRAAATAVTLVIGGWLGWQFADEIAPAGQSGGYYSAEQPMDESPPVQNVDAAPSILGPEAASAGTVDPFGGMGLGP